MSNLLPPGAKLVDLGCGSGQFLLYLAECRPDIEILGIDLSENMVRIGNSSLRDAGFSERVRLVIGDMAEFRNIVDCADLVSSVFSLHHLPAMDDVGRCLKQIVRLTAGTACGVWIFDHVRPRQSITAQEFPDIFTPDAAPAFLEDSRNSLRAAFSFRELSQLLDRCSSAAWQHENSKVLRLYQAHWLEQPALRRHEGHELFVAPRLTTRVRSEVHQLRRILPIPFATS